MRAAGAAPVGARTGRAEEARIARPPIRGGSSQALGATAGLTARGGLASRPAASSRLIAPRHWRSGRDRRRAPLPRPGGMAWALGGVVPSGRNRSSMPAARSGCWNGHAQRRPPQGIRASRAGRAASEAKAPRRRSESKPVSPAPDPMPSRRRTAGHITYLVFIVKTNMQATGPSQFLSLVLDIYISTNSVEPDRRAP
jgi:hypothetical protein